VLELGGGDGGGAVSRVVWLIAVVGCASASRIGPFVKSVARQGSALAVVTCEIVLDGNELHEGACYTQMIPLGSEPGPPGASEPAPPVPPRR
jgi:hypothetical protein